MREYDMVDGYRLEVGPMWREVSPYERADLCNGVGAADQPEWLARLLATLPYLLPASRPHDLDYWAGRAGGTRLEADQRFRRNCYRVAKARLGAWWRRLFVSAVRVQWVLAVAEIEMAYLALRRCGGAAWTYK